MSALKPRKSKPENTSAEFMIMLGLIFVFLLAIIAVAIRTT